MEPAELGMVCWGSGRFLKEKEKMQFLFRINNILSPKPSQPILVPIFHTKKREVDSVVSVSDYFFLSVSTPTTATATMTAIAEPMIVMV